MKRNFWKTITSVYYDLEINVQFLNYTSLISFLN